MVNSGITQCKLDFNISTTNETRFRNTSCNFMAGKNILTIRVHWLSFRSCPCSSVQPHDFFSVSFSVNLFRLPFLILIYGLISDVCKCYVCMHITQSHNYSIPRICELYTIPFKYCPSTYRNMLFYATSYSKCNTIQT